MDDAPFVNGKWFDGVKSIADDGSYSIVIETSAILIPTWPVVTNYRLKENKDYLFST